MYANGRAPQAQPVGAHGGRRGPAGDGIGLACLLDRASRGVDVGPAEPAGQGRAVAAPGRARGRDRAGHLHRTAANRGAAAAERAARRRLWLAALEPARERLIEHARAGRLHAEGLQNLEQELDFEELRVRAVLGDERSPAEKAAAAARRRAPRPV